MMQISSEMINSLQVLTVDESRIDAAAAIQFKDHVKELTRDSSGHVVLNLEKVDFIDSSGLGSIVSAKKFLGHDRHLHLAGLTELVAKVFSLTRMERVFKIYETASEAVTEETRERA